MLCRVAAAAALATVAALLLCSGGAHAQQQGGAVSELCLGCICEAVSGCNRTLTCTGDVCGLFRITWAYWADSGKPVIAGDNPDADGAYARCVTDAYCAARAVQGYMAKFAKDCNGDGAINCDDYAAIHRLGGYGCNGNVDAAYANRYNACRNTVTSLGPI
ncbi:I-type lysozyme [Gryllus bimaculatus]|nr:I-type lysozyme [Gryllus bimaculatus]